MESRVCSNVLCGTSSSSSRWVRGWPLRSGGFANLCDHCGSAYEQSVFCYTFHLKESGWRDCDTCSTRLHCGCVASKTLLVLTDNGGVQCISCAKRLEIPFISIDETPDGISMTANSSIRELQLTSDYKLDGDHLGMGKLVNLCNLDGRDHNGLIRSQKDDTNGFSGMIKREQTLPSLGELGPTTFPNFSGTSFGSTQTIKQNNHRESVGVKDMYDSLSQTCLTMTIGAPSGNANFAKPIACAASEERDQSKMAASLQQVQRSRPRTSKTGHGTAAESSKDNFPQLRVARPPVEGRGRNQLLPRYWPRITDQELQQISGDSNSTITPLFEKVLSASDAGRIGRLVLPKACAEAYFPPISQPEGLPLRIQDVKGKEWHFQFRFWPNNNSRMYVLEGVTPCIQSMQLQAGDTVTFSRLDPEGKLVMGFRKASNCVTLKDTQMTAVANGSNENFFSGSVENFGYAGLLQPLKGSNVLSEHLRSTDGDANLCKIDKHGGLSLQAIPIPEKKRSRNIGSKSKRLVIDAEDALELKFTWEEAHDLLRPPPSVNPSIVRIDDYEFEEYEEPPIFGKRSIFTSRSSGGQDQWVQCDSCSKWRRLPVDVLLPAKWSCSDNAWDSKRYSCGAPNELSPTEVDNLLKMNVDFKRRKVDPEPEPSGLDALATAAVESFVATTTKHPRHRIGCTCIVCIQPPSGKGPKHKPTCTCNVCMTVKRRFKTLMMRKKKRQSDKEAAEVAAAAAAANSKQQLQLMQHAMEMEVESAASGSIYAPQPSNDQGNNSMEEKIETGIDLNCDPEGREDDGVSMMSLLQVANQPLETYLRQNGLASLTTEQQGQQEQEQEQEQDHHVDSAAGEEED